MGRKGSRRKKLATLQRQGVNEPDRNDRQVSAQQAEQSQPNEQEVKDTQAFVGQILLDILEKSNGASEGHTNDSGPASSDTALRGNSSSYPDASARLPQRIVPLHRNDSGGPQQTQHFDAARTTRRATQSHPQPVAQGFAGYAHDAQLQQFSNFQQSLAPSYQPFHNQAPGGGAWLPSQQHMSDSSNFRAPSAPSIVNKSMWWRSGPPPEPQDAQTHIQSQAPYSTASARLGRSSHVLPVAGHRVNTESEALRFQRPYSTRPQPAPSRRSPPRAAKDESRWRRGTSEIPPPSHGRWSRESTPNASDRPRRYNLRPSTLKLPVPVPVPTQAYLDQSAQPPQASSRPLPQLIILDLNGTLIHRPDRKKGAGSFINRPFVEAFLEYLLQDFTVMVWSSAKPSSVEKMCGRLFTPAQRKQLIAEWGRDTLGLSTAQYNEKVQVYKQLSKVWDADAIKSRHPDYMGGENRPWDQSNTILLDDSIIKASSEPYNLVQIPEFEALPKQMEKDILRQVVGYLEEVRCQKDVSAFMRRNPFKVDGGWDWIWPEGAVNQSLQLPVRSQRSESVLTDDTDAFGRNDWLRLALSPERLESSWQELESQKRKAVGEAALQQASKEGESKHKLDPVEHKRVEKLRASIPGLTTAPPAEFKRSA